MSEQRWQVGDRVQIRDGKLQGVVTGVTDNGSIGVKWDDGDEVMRQRYRNPN